MAVRDLAPELSGPEGIGSILYTYASARHTPTTAYASRVVTSASRRQRSQLPARRWRVGQFYGFARHCQGYAEEGLGVGSPPAITPTVQLQRSRCWEFFCARTTY